MSVRVYLSYILSHSCSRGKDLESPETTVGEECAWYGFPGGEAVKLWSHFCPFCGEKLPQSLEEAQGMKEEDD